MEANSFREKSQKAWNSSSEQLAEKIAGTQYQGQGVDSYVQAYWLRVIFLWFGLVSQFFCFWWHQTQLWDLSYLLRSENDDKRDHDDHKNNEQDYCTDLAHIFAIIKDIPLVSSRTASFSWTTFIFCAVSWNSWSSSPMTWFCLWSYSLISLPWFLSLAAI